MPLLLGQRDLELIAQLTLRNLPKTNGLGATRTIRYP